MIWFIIEMLFVALLVVLPARLYNSDRPFMAKFYLKMVSSRNARKLYLRCFLILVLLYHFVYAGGHPQEWGILLSTVLCAVLFTYRIGHRILRELYYDRRKVILVALIALAICAVPHLHTCSVTLGYFLLAKMFYPSFRFMSQWRYDAELRNYCMSHQADIRSSYFH